MKVPFLVKQIAPPDRVPSLQFFLPVLLICKYPIIEKEVTFLVDTGATYTTLQDRDVRRLKIKYDDLERKAEGDWSKGIEGKRIETFHMRDVRLLLLSQDRSRKLWGMKLPAIDVLKHPKEDWEMMKDIPSLLGMDVLGNFRLVIDKSVPEAYIEPPGR